MKKAKQYQPKKLDSKKFHKPKQNVNKKLYASKEWTIYRFRFLHHNKLCYVCANPARHVDHLVSVRTDPDKYFWKEDNYLPLCHSCHSIVTARFDRGAEQDLEGKLRWINEERVKRSVTIRVKVVPFKEGQGVSSQN